MTHHTLSAAVLLAAAWIILPTAAHAQASRTRNPVTQKQAAKPATPTAGSQTDFTLPVDQLYCDTSLPYSYTSTRNAVSLTVDSSGDWNKVLTQDWKDWNTTAKPSPGVQVQFGSLHTLDQGGRDDPPTAKNVLNDNGEPLLADPAHVFSANTFDAQRLLVRTLFGPNPSPVACAYPYLKYPDLTVPGDNDKEIHLGADGKPVALLEQGAGYAFSLNGGGAPQYYLINVVRWQETDPPKGAPAKVPFFQAASDEWYLLNYSDDQARHQDVAKMFQRITPEMVTGTLRLLGSRRVMFLGIQLAPQPTLNKDIPAPANLHLVPTEQAWFDGVTLQYKIHADAVEPTNITDLKVLASILSSDVSAVTGLPTNVGSTRSGFTSEENLLDAFLRQNSAGDRIVLSTYQGRYAAGILTNLTRLPVNLADSWTATFTVSATPGMPGASIYSSSSAKPITTKPAAVADTTKPGTVPANSASICTIALTDDKKAQAPCSHTGVQVHNEGRALWDVSVAVPAGGYSDVTYQTSTTGGATVVSPKTVTRTNAYGLFDLFLVREDLLNPPYIGIPHIVAGLPFAGKTFDKPYFGFGETLNFPRIVAKIPGAASFPVLQNFSNGNAPISLRPTFGWVWNKEFPVAGGVTTPRRVLKPQFGIEISIGTIKNAATTLGKGKASTSTTPSK